MRPKSRCLSILSTLPILLPPLLVPGSRALAEPPYQLDDPDVIPYRWHEFYVWAGAASSPGVVNTEGPALEFNWSPIPHTMFHLIAPLGASIPTGGGPTTFGPTDGECIAGIGSRRAILENSAIRKENLRCLVDRRRRWD